MAHVLYSFRRCPYAMRARLAIAISGLDPELREVDLKHRPDALRACSPKATVPVLIRNDDVVLDESLDVMKFALGVADPEGWLPDPSEQTGTDALLRANDGPFKTALDRFKYTTRYPDAEPETAREQAVEFIEELEQRLRAQRFLCREKISFADVAIFPFVRQFAGVNAKWFAATPFAEVRRWLGDWTEHPLFVAVMAKHPPWQEGSPPLPFRKAYALPV